MTLDLWEAVVAQSFLSMLQLRELDEGKVEVLEERPIGKNMFDESLYEINLLKKAKTHLPLDDDLTRADTILVVLADVHVARVARQVSKVDRAISILSWDIDAAVKLTEWRALGKLDESWKVVHL